MALEIKMASAAARTERNLPFLRTRATQTYQFPQKYTTYDYNDSQIKN